MNAASKSRHAPIKRNDAIQPIITAIPISTLSSVVMAIFLLVLLKWKIGFSSSVIPHRQFLPTATRIRRAVDVARRLKSLHTDPYPALFKSRSI